MKSIHIENSYTTWSRSNMFAKIIIECDKAYGSFAASRLLNRSYGGMFVEWWLHNIGYYLTRPFIKCAAIKKINERFQHVDLEEHV